MPIITFKGNGSKETGNTSTAIAMATFMAIEHNMKILLVSTGFNEETVKESFWTEQKKKSKLQPITSIQSGIEGLSKMINSGKIEPRTIRNYSNVVLTNRLDVLLGYTGDPTQYKLVQVNYDTVLTVANQYYDMVVVDLDRKLLPHIQEKILQVSDVIVATVCQKLKEIQKLNNYINQSEFLSEKNTLISIGRYDDYLKCNAKNVTRNVFRRKALINTVPYNGKYYEAMQYGSVIDLFLSLLTLKNKQDHNYYFIQEIKRLAESVNMKWEEIKMLKNI